jgi:hypothetical protein
MLKLPTHSGFHDLFLNYNMTSLFPLVEKNPELFLRIIPLTHAPMNVTDVSIGSINCYPNNADIGRNIIRVT